MVLLYIEELGFRLSEFKSNYLCNALQHDLLQLIKL